MCAATSISLPHYRLAGEIAEYICQQATEREMLSLKNLSRKFGACETILKTIFKQRHSTSIHQYIMEKRIDLAKDLLCVERKTVKETAWSLGYQEIGHFSRDFKKITGESPRMYVIVHGMNSSQMIIQS